MMQTTHEEREALDRHAEEMLNLFLTLKPRPQSQGLFFCRMMDDAAKKVLASDPLIPFLRVEANQ